MFIHGRMFQSRGLRLQDRHIRNHLPIDRLIIDRHVRFVGDVVAIIAATDEKAALKAMKLIKVKYDILEPVLDFHQAKDSAVLVHPGGGLVSTHGSWRRSRTESGCQVKKTEMVMWMP